VLEWIRSRPGKGLCTFPNPYDKVSNLGYRGHLTPGGGYPLRHREHTKKPTRKEKPMFQTLQDVFDLITRPGNVPQSAWINPTVRDIQHRLLERFGVRRTRRQIRRLLRELEQEGIIRRETRSGQQQPRSPQERAPRYEIVQPDTLPDRRLHLLLANKRLTNQERRRWRREKDQASLIAIGRAYLQTISREEKEAGE